MKIWRKVRFSTKDGDPTSPPQILKSYILEKLFKINGSKLMETVIATGNILCC